MPSIQTGKPLYPCEFFLGRMKESCDAAYQEALKQWQDQQNNPGAKAPSNNGVFSGPGSDWWRHAVFRVVEVIVGVAMITAAVKTISGSSPTIKVISQGAKKAWKL